MDPRRRPVSEPLRPLPTAALAALGLTGGFGVAVASGSRPLGGVVLAAFGLSCIAVWRRRHSRRATAALTAAGLLAFALSHALGLVIGAWPAVALVSAATAGLYWAASDSAEYRVQAADRAHAVRARRPAAAEQHRLDPRAAGTGDVLLEAVADVDRGSGGNSG